MPEHLADLRAEVTDLEQAKLVLAKLASLECATAYADAKLEKQIAALKESHATFWSETRMQIADLKDKLLAFILANRILFKRPRKIATECGSFGLQKATKVKILNQDALVKWLLEQGYDDCLKTVRKPVKSAIQARLEAEEKIPHVALPSGDIAVYSIAKELIADAQKKGAE
jgi:phage host-nuclease inhibitor protein Gam